MINRRTFLVTMTVVAIAFTCQYTYASQSLDTAPQIEGFITAVIKFQVFGFGQAV